jgi:heme ABC exporter ATP-binding subunit CcmA
MTEIDLSLRLSGVSKRFGRQVALNGVDLEVPPGCYLAVMGPNGAGKTTLLKVMAGLASPTSGRVTLAGVEARRAGPGLRRLVGYVSHESMLYPDLTARENLLFYGRLFGVEETEAKVEAVAEALGVTASLDRPVRALSRGTRQRVTLARALLHSPRVLLLDEPYTGLDEAGAAGLARTLLSLHQEGRTVVVAVHEVYRALDGPERLVILDRGRVVLDTRVAEHGADLQDLYLSLLSGGGKGRG